MDKRLAVFAAIALLLVGAAAHADDAATLLLLHGRVWTEDPAKPEAQAVAIAGHRILVVGSDAEIGRLARPGVRVIDLAGRRVLPGFNDSHVHFLQGGSAVSGVQLGDADSPAEFKRRIGEYARTQPKGTWIGDGNWDHQRWHPAELPTHALIDDVTPDNPVMVWRLDGHMVLLNALALRLAGIDRNTRDPAGGEIVHDAAGEPTGILKDAAVDLVQRVVPPPSDAELDAALRAALDVAVRHGITSVQDMSESPEDVIGPRRMATFDRFHRAGLLTVRVYESVTLRRWRELADLGIRAGFGDDMFRIGNLKSFADGALGSTTALMRDPYTNRPDYRGLANGDLLDPARMFDELVGARRAGLQVSIHAIGDLAIHQVLDLIERADQAVPEGGPRARIEHVQHLDPADIPRFKSLGVIASMQPYHAIDDGRWAERYIGHERARSSYAWKSLLDAGATLAFGSDWPVAPLDAIAGIDAAVNRRTLDGANPQGWIPEQRIGVRDAVHAYTVGSAVAEGMEAEKGSLAAGKLADLIVLSEDILTVPAGKIGDARVDLTICNGKVVFERQATAHARGASTR